MLEKDEQFEELLFKLSTEYLQNGISDDVIDLFEQLRVMSSDDLEEDDGYWFGCNQIKENCGLY